MTKICVSLTEETTAGVVERMEELAGIADLFEVRADFVLDLDLLTILRGRTRPILLTCRAVNLNAVRPDANSGIAFAIADAFKLAVPAARRHPYFNLDIRGGARLQRRRGGRHPMPWHRMCRHINRWLPTVRIWHPYPLVRFGVVTQGGSRMR